MNSSPPPPSFVAPPLTSKGRLPITPSPTQSPTDEVEDGFEFGDDARTKRQDKGKGRDVDRGGEAYDVGQDGGRVSMYVQLFEEMIHTVLESEEYLFTRREIFVLKTILSLPYAPKYLLTRLLLRRPGKIHPYSNLCPTYSPELGEEGVKSAARALTHPLEIPEDIKAAEPVLEPDDGDERTGHAFRTPLKPSISPVQPTSTSSSRPYPTPTSAAKPHARGKRKHGERHGVGSGSKSKPWSDLPTGLSAAEEKADPDLAEAIRESLWASRVGRVELDDDGSIIHTPPPERSIPSVAGSGANSRSVSNGSSTSTSSSSSFPLEGSRRPSGMGSGGLTSKLALEAENFTLQSKAGRPITVFARDHTDMNLDQIMSCVSAEDLRKIARGRKVPLASLATRSAVETALRSLAAQQTVLGFTPSKTATRTTTPVSRKISGTGSVAMPVTPGGRVTTESLIVASLIPHLGGSAIQLTPQIHALIARVNLIYSRTPPLTATSSSLMLPSILVASHKRRYPDYGPPTRSKIWSNRDELLTWERATHYESVVADALGETWLEQRKNVMAMPGYGVKMEPPKRVEGATIVKTIWKGVWPVWKGLVEGKGAEEVDASREQGGLVGDRFKTGHVLTRIVYKSAVALGMLHEYDLECEVLKALLAQRRWRRSKRGAWYERLALVLMNHYNASPHEKIQKMREATQVCIDGLLDDDTHLIYRPGLSRRLTRLENRLDLPSDERHISHAELLKCETRELAAPRVPENLGAPKIRPRADSARDREREASLGLGDDAGGSSWGLQQTGKSVWVGKESEVTVEGWVLEWWEKKGYKGYHSEGSILTTLFALLMWPILFHPLPGSFETPYQTAPLDLGEDTFAPARSALIEARLEEMDKTSRALEMLKEADDAQREKGTWAVGLNWEYGKEDLEELVACLGGRALSVICRMLAEEYRHRVSGVPDLIVWHYETREARFIEVKGPGDSLSETQKIWIDVLLSAGVPVEVCKVSAQDPAISRKAMDKLTKWKAAHDVREARVNLKAMAMAKKEEGDLGIDDLNEVYDLDDDEDEDEWKYESGDEGKDEGHWEGRGGSRKKARRS